ncbi:MAG: isochorismatase family cysteine hydrolase [Anaerolineaceae bacterium]
MISNALSQQAAPYLAFLENWLDTLPSLSLAELLAAPDEVAIFSVDLTNGFCVQGPLASPRVAAIVAPVAHLLQAAWEKGVRQILLLQDAHEPNAVEFNQFPPHCVRGTIEAQAVDELKALPFYDALLQIPKNSIHSGLNTGLKAWLDAHLKINTFIVVGDCTDLCVDQLAMYLRLDANAFQIQRRVIVPVNCVDTYDFPVEAAQAVGGVPHPAELLHAVFLHHLMLNGIEVVARLD